MADRDDSFELYDLRVEVIGTERPMVCSHRVGDSFEVSGENITFPAGQSFSLYALAALLPLLPAKQRATPANDWMTTDTDIACPDPNCGARFRVSRLGTRIFRHRDVTAVPLPPSMSGAIPRIDLAPGYTISRILKGGWQLAGGHGAIDRATALDDMARFVDAGVTTFDCADIYTGVEALIGDFMRTRRAAGRVQVHTKYVPDLDTLAHLTRADVDLAIDRSLRRLGVERLDLVQFHWWDFDIPRYVEVARWLDEIRRAGKIGLVGATNFDVPRLREIVDAGVPIASHQVQYSVLDRRPASTMTAFCAERQIPMLCFGAVAGGFLSDRYLGQPEPAPPLNNRSHVKYRLIIAEYGGWDRFQRLLQTLADVARRHRATISSVALGWVLDRPQVAGVIVGARHARHLDDLRRVSDVRFTEADREQIDAALAESTGPAGDVYELERVKSGSHASAMRYTLNAG